MKYTLLFLSVWSFLLVLSSCKKQTKEAIVQEKVTENLRGKYRMTTRPDTTKPVAGFIFAMLSTSMEFRDGGKGMYSSSVGSLGNQMPFEWNVKGDSLILTIGNPNRFKIEKFDEGYKYFEMRSGDIAFLLEKMSE